MTDNQRQHFGPRLKEIRLAKKMTLQEFYSPIAKHVNNFSPIENGSRMIGKRLSEDVIRYYHINESWLATGVGKIYSTDELLKETNQLNTDPEEGVPYINVNPSDFSSGELNFLKEKPEYYVNFRPFNDCDAYLPVYGDSMFPKYSSGEIIAIREVVNKDIIQWGEAYLIMADESANSITTVKLLFEHDTPGKIILRAANSDYKGDTILDKQAINRLFIVKGKITRNQL
ncbi:phage repressor protein C with HTH and peptisase S24 domain [Pedobacter cryoconitis]|uniref:Phage repressor protein C with HTH and peptisase S24 domain n=1 Tax=Pedobacter cryoconitis TaxID=188932 RepID=A0A7W9DM23_9SPHI|nr:helix-turn-helix transcriptional regulator [Pedobacter cryoconitis]MBB5622765.1 phage repressor protein C with HTH and peptisase S24 domain [Pedobacter cryoconitis]MBB5648955.1 phage repressor protein C with HTH and peptisase S24 domain [Pedobacter cryoconitis]